MFCIATLLKATAWKPTFSTLTRANRSKLIRKERRSPTRRVELYRVETRRVEDRRSWRMSFDRDKMKSAIAAWAAKGVFIGTSNELGGFESGTVAHWLGPVFAVVSGGVGTILVVMAVALLWPQIRSYGRLDGP